MLNNGCYLNITSANIQQIAMKFKDGALDFTVCNLLNN